MRRDRARRPSNAVQSRPVDPDKLTARLLRIPADNTSPRLPSRQPPSAASTPPGPSEEEIETEGYNELVKNGGRPLYPIDLVEKIAKDPKAYRDMLRPWNDTPLGTDPEGKFRDWGVFWRQFESWRSFRAWQKLHRKDFSGRRDAWFYAGRAYKSFVRAYELWDDGLPEYAEAVKKLLAQHGFTRPFQFHEDPTQQDKLTTWIEYLGYECWVSETYTRFLQSKQPSYDEAWKKLVDSNVLRSFETEDYVCGIKCWIQHDFEENEAWKAVESARSAAKAVLVSARKDVGNPRGSRFTSHARAQMMLAAKSKLDAAKESLQSIRKRNDLVTEFTRATGKYRTAKKDAERRRPRLRWILEQVPLIEAELNEPSAAETCSNTSRRTKRKLGCDNDKSMQDRSRKKRKRSSGVFGKHRRDDPVDDTPPSKRLKNGGKGLAPHETSDGTGAELDNDSQGATQAGVKAGKLNGDGHTKAKMQGSGRKANGPSNSHLLRKKRTRNAPQPSADSRPLRCSARIAARQEVLKPFQLGPASPKAHPEGCAEGYATQAPTPSRPTVAFPSYEDRTGYKGR